MQADNTVRLEGSYADNCRISAELYNFRSSLQTFTTQEKGTRREETTITKIYFLEIYSKCQI